MLKYQLSTRPTAIARATHAKGGDGVDALLRVQAQHLFEQVDRARRQQLPVLLKVLPQLVVLVVLLYDVVPARAGPAQVGRKDSSARLGSLSAIICSEGAARSARSFLLGKSQASCKQSLQPDLQACRTHR